MENPQLPPILGHPSQQQARRSLQPLHVLTLTPFYPSEEDDSAGCFIAEPIERLTALGLHHSVLALQPFYRKRSRAPQSGTPVQWHRYFSIPGGLGLPTAGAFAFAAVVGKVRELHATHRIDLIHAHAPLPCGHVAMLLSRELEVPYVVSVHGLDAFSTNQVSGHAGEWCRRISQRVYCSSKRVVCISEHVREQVLEGTGGGCRTSVVYNGVDPEMFSPSEQVTSEAFQLLSVGNLIPIKGHDVVLRAMAALAPKFPALSLEIIGEGREHAALEKLANDLAIGGRVRFLGRRSRREVADAMRRCTLFVLPSRYEGLGCVYLEAMSSGKPAIGCRGQGIAEIIQHGTNGFLVGPDNDRELALAITMLLEDEQRRRNIGNEARDTILDRLTLTQQAEHLARIYRECAP